MKKRNIIQYINWHHSHP